MWALFIAGGAIIALLIAATFWTVQAEQRRRTAASCDGSVQARANQLVSAEILIVATAPTEPTEPADGDEPRQRAVDRFRALQEQIWLSELPATCAGLMTLPEFQRAVTVIVDDTLAGLQP
jgi:hypothetical protein